MKPKQYDIKNPCSMKRWFREMERYLKTSDFINTGTDRDGRCYAIDGFRQLRSMMYKEKGLSNYEEESQK
jgi:hypothetical protein